VRKTRRRLLPLTEPKPADASQQAPVAVAVHAAADEGARVLSSQSGSAAGREAKSPSKRAVPEGMQRIYVQEVVEGMVIDVEKLVPVPPTAAPASASESYDDVASRRRANGSKLKSLPRPHS